MLCKTEAQGSNFSMHVVVFFPSMHNVAGFHPEIFGWGGSGRGTFMYSTPIKC